MKTLEKINSFLLLLLCCFICLGIEIDAVQYDYSYIHECLSEPPRPQYEGGIVTNPELSDGLKGWSAFGSAKVEKRVSANGNHFIVASQRNRAYDSFSQKFNLEKDKFYTFSAWLQVSHGNADIAAMFKTAPSDYEAAGWVTAQANCWSMLKGGLVVNASGLAELYFESKNSSVDIRADSISLQPFTQEEWKSHQDFTVEKFRKGKVRLQAIDGQGKPLANAKVSITQKAGAFPLGCAVTDQILTNKAYQNWFISRFKYTTFENEMKWYSTEPSPGKVNYAAPDAMVRLLKGFNVAIRGHNVFWDDPQFQPGWVKSLSPAQLGPVAGRRINSLVGRYVRQLIHWDVVNENLHHSFFEDKLGRNASAIFYRLVNAVDRNAIPFLNDYNTLEEKGDAASSPANYLGKIRELRAFGYGGPLGIGLEGHFSTPNLPYVRSAIDILASARLPIWITELDVTSGPNQAIFLEQIIREAHAHPAIGGIILWAAWKPQGCYRMCLTDNNFRNLPTGDVVDKIRREWRLQGFVGTTDSNGYFEANLFHGDYHVEFNHPTTGNSSFFQSLKVTPEENLEKTVHVQVSA